MTTSERNKKKARCVVCRRVLGVRNRWRHGSIGDNGPDGPNQQFVLPSHINEFTRVRCGGSGWIFKRDELAV